MKCTNCGKKVKNGATFCPNCGNKVSYTSSKTPLQIFKEGHARLALDHSCDHRRSLAIVIIMDVICLSFL